jgi:glycosyltransferase involved in cell wall biosynthesis
MNKYPRILIYGSPFNNMTGAGITLTNLFRGWSKDKIAVTSTGHELQNITTDVCDTYYLLGDKEKRWIFPFNLLQRSFTSGLIEFDHTSQDLTGKSNIEKASLRKMIVDKIFYPVLQHLGLIHFLSKISMSDQFTDWLEAYKPELLYIQVSTREDIIFATQLRDYLGIPSVIHIMDDWPSTISNKGLFKKRLHHLIDKDFRNLLSRMDLCLGISNAMKNEYLRRYNREFKAFHNPIETSAWEPYCKHDFRLNGDHVNVLYSGRIGTGITESLIEVAQVIEEINHSWGKVRLYIQSPSNDYEVIKKLQKFDCIVINPIVQYDQLPLIFSKADLLLIANDFHKEGIDFLKYSMPTKVSEYMISGTPILIYASGETAVSKFFDENECGCCVTEQDPVKLNDAFRLLIDNEEYRQKIGFRAVDIAKELFDADKVKNDFQQLIINLVK